jgi:hypothetical protein
VRRGCGLFSAASEQGPVADYSENDNDLSASIEVGEFIGKLSDCQFLKYSSVEFPFSETLFRN